MFTKPSLVLAALTCSAAPAQALGPWELKNPFGQARLWSSLVLEEEVVTHTFEGLVRVRADGSWERLSGEVNLPVPGPGLEPYPSHICQDGVAGYVHANGGGIWKTLDGRTWNRVLSAPPFRYASNLACRNDTFHVHTDNAAYRAVAGGQGWTRIFQDSINMIGSNSIFYANGETFLINSGWIKRSDDSGKTWLPSRSLGFPFALVATRQDIFLMDRGKVFLYDLGKKSWNLLDSALGVANSIAANGDYLHVVVSNEIWRTRNRAANWEVNGLMKKPGEFGYIQVQATDSACVLAGYDGGYFLKPFQSVPRKITPAAKTVPVAQGRNLLAYPYRSADGGATWEAAGAFSGYQRRLAANERSFFAATDKGLFGSTSGGREWTTLATPKTLLGITDLALSGDTVLYAEGRSIYRSFDGGKSWSGEAGIAPPPTIYRMFLHGGNLLAWDTTSVYRSQDLGGSWSAGTRFYRGEFADMDAMQAEASRGKLFLARYRTFISSSDGGVTWDSVAVPGGIVTVLEGTPQFLYASSVIDTLGVLASPDGGMTWERKNQGLHTLRVEGLSHSQGILYLMTQGGGYYSSEVSGVPVLRPRSGPPRWKAESPAIRPVDARGRSYPASRFPPSLIPFR